MRSWSCGGACTIGRLGSVYGTRAIIKVVWDFDVQDLLRSRARAPGYLFASSNEVHQLVFGTGGDFDT